MAEHRKSFRPRRLGSGGRHLPRSRLFGAALAILAALVLAPSSASSQDVGLTRGEASLDSGQYEAAIRQLSATVNDGKSTLEQASKALYLRGIAYRKLGMTGRAVADLGAAIWLGLDSSDKVRALVNKGLAFKAAGLSGQADAALDQARRASSAGTVDNIIAKDGAAQAVASSSASSDVASGAPSASVWDRVVPSMPSLPSFGSSSSSSPAPTPAQETAEAEAASQPEQTRTAEAAPSTGWTAEVSDETAEPSGNAVSRWFGSLTGDSAPAPPPPPAASNPIPAQTTTAARSSTPPQTTTATRTAAAPPSAESWAANTETEREGEGGTAIGRWFNRQTTSAPAPSAAPSQAPQSAGYTVQLANSQSKAEAEALWKKARSSSSQAASAGSRIEKVDIGSFGTFYSVKIGPFASQSESTKVCNALKRGGTDCSVVSPDGP